MKFVDFYNTLTEEERISLEACTPYNLYRVPVQDGLDVTDVDDCRIAVLYPGEEGMIHEFLETHEYIVLYKHVRWEPDQAKIEALGEVEDVIREHVHGFVLKKWNSGIPPANSLPLLNALERAGVVYRTETVETYTETVVSYRLPNSGGEAQ